jgi:hypothetical protein
MGEFVIGIKVNAVEALNKEYVAIMKRFTVRETGSVK